jgi:hypothetical protein
MQQDRRRLFDAVSNICLPFFTILGFSLTALKMPQWGLVSSLISEIFWFYSAYRAWKDANQIGILITTAIVTLVLLGGVINYWLM